MRNAYLFLLLTACVTHLDKPGGTSQEFQRDLYECKKDAAPVQSMPRYNAMVDECLAVKGWH